jgi:hypothetical protein
MKMLDARASGIDGEKLNLTKTVILGTFDFESLATLTRD